MSYKIYELETFDQYDIVIIVSMHNGEYLLSKHKKSAGWEFQGGPIEEGETPVLAAQRELAKETGACGFTMQPLCDFTFGDEDKKGVAFVSNVYELGPLGEGDMRERKAFKELPAQLQYPEITNLLVEKKEELDE